LVIVFLATLYVGIPFDLVSTFLTMVSIIISIGGYKNMVKINDIVVSGAHGVAKLILLKLY